MPDGFAFDGRQWMKRSVRAAALGLCLAVPVGFYALADAVDALPGVITIDRASGHPPVNPPAAAETMMPPAPQAIAPVGPSSGAPAGQSSADPDADPSAAASGDAVQPTVSGDQITAAMMRAAEIPVVNNHLAFSVVDARTGETIAEHDGDTARVPASTMKLLTSVAAARHIDLDSRLTTSTHLKGGDLFLRGGGDMMLTTESAASKPVVKEDLSRASITDLARATADDLKKQGVTSVALHLDDTAFADDPVNPAWGRNGPSGGWVAPITAIAVDGGRLDGEPYGPKSTNPSEDALTAFPAELEKNGITVTGEPNRAAVPKDAAEIAQVQSAPIRDLIHHTLIHSDNTTAELLGRLVAAEQGKPTTVAGARDAVQEDITLLARDEGLHADGLRIADNSGLSADNRIPPRLLAELNAWSTGEAPDPVREVFTLVPISGLEGTLTDRFEASSVTDARGIVRGKTGYLAGTSSLTGITTLADGRVVGFSIVVYGFDGADADAARAAVDTTAALMIREQS
ncbi:D-alanyl-D-alanine carboxypeptidase [Helcobacillus massiliensis]|uniref:D-alanyl-D-alanine carboxypeptidase/D-alanyl-D-alanine-endopeptidase n=1 Tax=Helcobacillus massiliensis TaxID=521392 RepID=UPI0021A31BD1|nr:D-alanyl-D-alanine carboxypeptidase [Helcobacillus massiliensis]MCT1558259.1 D-alanyl-D-alanine carboxypeptidase [Helcobacillus massiliensis]MCT2035502.1 D-alanyl-D-alanine carboxypeptidase [Helcobacillus massiliensis]MCT2332003.1 D-alanyl-D-alanine carboxypeptidase [Helcobacillus massiliensis]